MLIEAIILDYPKGFRFSKKIEEQIEKAKQLGIEVVRSSDLPFTNIPGSFNYYYEYATRDEGGTFYHQVELAFSELCKKKKNLTLKKTAFVSFKDESRFRELEEESLKAVSQEEKEVGSLASAFYISDIEKALQKILDEKENNVQPHEYADHADDSCYLVSSNNITIAKLKTASTFENMSLTRKMLIETLKQDRMCYMFKCQEDALNFARYYRSEQNYGRSNEYKPRNRYPVVAKVPSKDLQGIEIKVSMQYDLIPMFRNNYVSIQRNIVNIIVSYILCNFIDKNITIESIMVPDFCSDTTTEFSLKKKIEEKSAASIAKEQMRNARWAINLNNEKFDDTNSSGIKEMRTILLQADEIPYEKLFKIKLIAKDKIKKGFRNWYSHSHFFGPGRHPNIDELYQKIAKVDLTQDVDKQLAEINNYINITPRFKS